jgi:hypothetical protein
MYIVRTHNRLYGGGDGAAADDDGGDDEGGPDGQARLDGGHI